MEKSMLRCVPVLVVSAVTAVLGLGCAASVEPVDPVEGEATVGVTPTEDEDAIGSVAQKEERRICYTNSAGRRVCREDGGRPAPEYEAPEYQEEEEAPPPSTGTASVCRDAPDTTACGRSAGFGGNRNTLYTCENGKLLGKEFCPRGCQHRPRGLTDYCI